MRGCGCLCCGERDDTAGVGTKNWCRWVEIIKKCIYNDLFSYCGRIRTFPTVRYCHFSSDIVHVASPILPFYGFIHLLACVATE